MDADQKGVLTREECAAVDLGSDPAKIDFDKLHENRLALLHKAYERSNIAPDGADVWAHPDLFQLNSENQPGTVGFNWRWRLAPGQVTDALADELMALTKRTGRVNWDILNG